MNNTLIAKIAGWAQFAGNTLGQLAAGGLPTTTIGWLTWIASLFSAVGIHAAAKTDGVK